jgi:predicted DCC family thiol-disulfide oxidoreductase YuxK
MLNMAVPTRLDHNLSTVIYDDRCRLCVNAKKGMERLAQEDSLPQVRFLPYQSEEAERYLGQHYSPGRPEAAFLVGPDGDIRRGLDAFLPLLPGMPGGKFLSAVIGLPLVRPLFNLAYRVLARHRYRWFGEVPAHRR